MPQRFASLALLLLFATLPASGQNAGYERRAPLAREFNPSQEEYVVEPGDTLWDISAAITGSPWNWPRVWSFNPEVSNPNWIYPGDLIRFYPSEEPLPDVQLIAGPREEPQVQEEPEPDVITDEPLIAEAVTQPSRPRRQFIGTFVTTRELEESGVITNALDDKILLSVSDDVFVTFPEDSPVKIGDQFLIYRTLRNVYHPETGSHYGYMTEITGLASVVGAGRDGVKRARVDKAMREIERGHYVTPLRQSPFIDLGQPVPATRDVNGVILAVEGSFDRLVGTQSVVFVDRGKEDGLMPGNELEALLEEDMYADHEIPATQIGRLLVVETRERTSVCLVQNALRELEPGTPVRTVRAGGASAPPPR